VEEDEEKEKETEEFISEKFNKYYQHQDSPTTYFDKLAKPHKAGNQYSNEKSLYRKKYFKEKNSWTKR
jgi:hypothetical protein